jgi:hypothetical protein
MSWRRWGQLALGAAVAAALTVVVGSGPAAADIDTQPAQSGSLTMTSDPGDYLGQGLSYAYSTEQGDQFYTQVRYGGTYLAVLVFAADGSYWTLSFATGFDGPPLAAGTYSSSTPGVWMGASADSRGCGTSTSTFTIREVVFGPYQYLERFDASFEFHCEGLDPATRGDVRIVNPPAPAPLELGVAVGAGTVNDVTGLVHLSGTVDCNHPVEVVVSGTLTQVNKNGLRAFGSFYSTVSCTGPATPWQATVDTSTIAAFNKGDAEAQVGASATDPTYNVFVQTTRTQLVGLKKEK